MLMEFGQASLLAKAKSQPEKVRQVLDKARTDGLLATVGAVFNRLDEPLPLGYCNAGEILEVGSAVRGFERGDRVISNGPHAEIVVVPTNLCAHIPENVSYEESSFTVLASIALHGIRLLQPTLGERVVVYGLGLIGLVTIQLLRVSGCDVLGIDVNPSRLKLAEAFGVRTVNPNAGGDVLSACRAWTEDKGADGVIVAASTKADDIMHIAAQISRKRGRIVLVGVVPLDLQRADFYEKELTFQVSCSYGPGRYDPRYEQEGIDYPFEFVRWTEQRNFEAVLQMMASGRLDVKPLITNRFQLEDVERAYQVILNDREALGVVLIYPEDRDARTRVNYPRVLAASKVLVATVGVIGAGNFSKMTLLPALSRLPARISYVADLDGANAAYAARKFGAANATTDYTDILHDPDVSAVLIAVGHHLHARLTCEALASGKRVFVEKPLAMNVEELKGIVTAMAAREATDVMVGFNRRFSPHAVKTKALLKGRSEPLAMSMTINAGAIPPGHWLQDPRRGGGRIIGEACHFLDLQVFLTGSKIKSVSASMMGRDVTIREDKMCITLSFEDGSIGTVNYFANGSKKFPKEKLEVFSQGRVLTIDNFRLTTGHGFKGFGRFRTFGQDKGHKAELESYLKSLVKGGAPLIPFDELVNVTLASFAAMTAAWESRTIDISREYASVLEMS